jgi:hypothetical protein
LETRTYLKQQVQNSLNVYTNWWFPDCSNLLEVLCVILWKSNNVQKEQRVQYCARAIAKLNSPSSPQRLLPLVHTTDHNSVISKQNKLYYPCSLSKNPERRMLRHVRCPNPRGFQQTWRLSRTANVTNAYEIFRFSWQ